MNGAPPNPINGVHRAAPRLSARPASARSRSDDVHRPGCPGTSPRPAHGTAALCPRPVRDTPVASSGCGPVGRSVPVSRPGRPGAPSSARTRSTARSTAATPSAASWTRPAASVHVPSPIRCSSRRATSAAVRTGASSTGPTSAAISTPTPARRSGTMMSEKRMAASTPWRRTGCSVASAASSGVRQTSSIGRSTRRRSARYSGSERPAWRMNQTGVRAGRRPDRASSRAGRGVPGGSRCAVEAEDVMMPFSIRLGRQPETLCGQVVTNVGQCLGCGAVASKGDDRQCIVPGSVTATEKALAGISGPIVPEAVRNA